MANCEVKKCKNESDLIYYNHEICKECYGKHCDRKIDLKKIFEIKDQQKTF
jgi:hypothetical protein